MSKVKFPDSCFAKMSTEGCPQLSLLQQLSLSFLGVFLTHFKMLEELLKSCCCIISAVWGSFFLHTSNGHPQQTAL